MIVVQAKQVAGALCWTIQVPRFLRLFGDGSATSVDAVVLVDWGHPTETLSATDYNLL